MADVQGKKIDVMFLFYEKEVHNILEDHIFETQCYDLDFEHNLFYTDSILLKGDNWIDSRQWQFYEAGSTANDQALDVYFQWLSFCYCTDYRPVTMFYKRWDKSLGKCACGRHDNSTGSGPTDDSWANTVKFNHQIGSTTADTIDICPSVSAGSDAAKIPAVNILSWGVNANTCVYATDKTCQFKVNCYCPSRSMTTAGTFDDIVTFPWAFAANSP